MCERRKNMAEVSIDLNMVRVSNEEFLKKQQTVRHS